ncbi:MAG: hypothetical protein MJE68_25940 [Proteobacteria bacterium]|nr:hypothetical protein [Pseudomonadota bacterium]
MFTCWERRTLRIKVRVPLSLSLTDIASPASEPRLSVLFEKFMLEVNKYNQNSEFSVVVTALTSRPQEIPSRVHALFLQQLEMAPPTKLQREVMLEALTRDYSIEVGLDIAELAKETAGFVLGDLVRLVSSGYDIAFKSLLEYWYEC